jgi:hypothetical protein
MRRKRRYMFFLPGLWAISTDEYCGAVVEL